jgi:hypothetical protein
VIVLDEIKRSKELAREVENFNGLYSTCTLWGSVPDGDVRADQLLAWMIENPGLAEIAADIAKLVRK